MNKLFLSLILLVAVGCAGGPSNTLDVDKVDDFTGTKIKRTHYQTIYIPYTTGQAYMFCRLSKIDNVYFFDYKIELTSGEPPIIEKDASLMIKLKSGKIIELKNLKFNMPCNGCGSTGFSNVVGVETSYPINKSDVQTISEDTPIKVRAYLEGGYVEEDIKDSDGTKISETARLVL